MTERSLFNVLCKSAGVFLLLRGVASLVRVFLASRCEGSTYFEPTAGASWFVGALSTLNDRNKP